MGYSQSVCLQESGNALHLGNRKAVYVCGVGHLRQWECCDEFVDNPDNHLVVAYKTTCNGRAIGTYGSCGDGYGYEWSCCGSKLQVPRSHMDFTKMQVPHRFKI